MPIPPPPPIAPHIARGRAAESRAERYLVAQGLVVIARNFRCRAGELDLVCRDHRVLAVVEVRARSGAGFGGALGSITARKRRRMMRATEYFLLVSKCGRGLPVRFDVVAIDGPAPEPTLTWVKGAFRC